MSVSNVRSAPKPFAEPVYITRPILPPLADYTALLEGVWRRQWLSNNGDLLLELHRRLTVHLQAPYLSLLGNGTLALQMAIRAFGLKGEVITTPFTFPATPNVLDWAGITPVFVDIDPVTLTLDPAAVERAIGPNTSAILGVHVYGTPCNVHALAGIASHHGIRVLYDAAHAFGACIDGVPIGAFGDATMLSFHATKLFHTAEGGALILRDGADLERVDLLRNFGIRDEVTTLAAGVNAKMTELQAGLGLLVLDHIDAEHAARARIAAVYQARFTGVPGLNMISIPPGVTNSHQYAVLQINEAETGISRDAVYEALKCFNIFARRYFYPLCSEAAHYRLLPSSAPENLPVAHRVAQEVLSLPYYGDLGEDGAERVAAAVLHTLGR